MQTARNVVPGRAKARKEREGGRKWIERRVTYRKRGKNDRGAQRTKETKIEGERERERERERSGRKIEKHVRMDAAHIISAMLLESSLRLGDHPWTVSKSHRLWAASSCHCVRLTISCVDPLSRNIRPVSFQKLWDQLNQPLTISTRR